jgi:hypothetical protein
MINGNSDPNFPTWALDLAVTKEAYSRYFDDKDTNDYVRPHFSATGDRMFTRGWDLDAVEHVVLSQQTLQNTVADRWVLVSIECTTVLYTQFLAA